MAHSNTVKHLNPLRLEFAFFHPEEIKNLSVVKVSVPISFNALGLPYKNGLYDPAMGPLSERGDICTTCRCPFFTCCGHFGHIELPLPVFNTLFLKSVYEVLRLACLNCYEIQVPENIRKVLVAQMRLLRAGCLVEAQQLTVNLAREVTCNDEQLDTDIEHAKEILHNVQEIKADVEDVLLNSEDAKNIEVLRAHYWSLAKEHFKLSKTCNDCHKPIVKINLVYNKLMTSVLKEETGEGKVVFHGEPTFITPIEAQNHLRELWSRYSDFIIALVPVLLNVKSQHPTDIFFIEVTPVPPPKVRPVTFIRDKINEHPQTLVYQQVLEHCVITQQVARIVHGGNVEDLGEENRVFYEGISGESPTEKLHHAWQGLQTAVDNLVDSELSNNGKILRASSAGLKQVISKKEGLIRMHMMGKRVNFAGRTVITPDPNLGVDEIGIPEAFAKVLTFPTPVTTWNVAMLREAVQNGPNIYPGATAVQLENGQTNRVSKDCATQRASLAKRLLTPANASQNASVGESCLKPPKVVLRHLQNGDVLLLNRQPTLHRPSIMAHRARVLKGEKTFRMHYANCKAYNADFDGDEMNAHFPQNEVSRAESYFLAEVARQYLVPKDGTPLSGLIQDHVVAGVRLSVRGRFFSRADFCALLQRAMPTLGACARLPRPALLRPRCLWSGKQLLSTVLLNCLPPGRQPLSLCDVAKISASAWTKPAAVRQWRAGGSPLRGIAMSEAEVIIRDGELLCGVLDKKHFGSTPYGLCHCLYELYGGECCIHFLSALGRLFTAFLQSEGFTLGVRDILVIPEANETRKKILEETRTSGPSAISKALDLPLPPQTENTIYQGGMLPPGAEVSLARLAAGDKRLRAALDRAYKQQLDPASDAVSKACLPAGLLERFPLNNLQLMVQSGAKGSTVNTLQISCLLGQIELEGKRPPLLASGKAMPSFCRFEPSPRAGGFVADRFLTGIRPQEFFFHCMAGREGLIDTAVKTSRSGYLQRCLIKHLEGLVVAYDGTVRDSDGSVVQFAYGEDGLDVLRAQFFKERQLPILADNYKAFCDDKAVQYLMSDCDTEEIKKAHKEVRHWRRRQQKLKVGIRSRERTSGVWARTPEPVAARVYPCDHVHALTERMDSLIGEYMKKHKGAEVEDVGPALHLRATLAYADAGEPVGLLAAQSIGEPSTQMTLNTFHFAGRGEMNVTLGIPRLREVLMLASRNPRTPSMEAPAIVGAAALDNLRRRLRRSHLAELLQDATVHEWLEISGSKRLRCYRVRLQLLPAHLLLYEHSVSTRKVLRHVEKEFLAQLFAELRRYWRTSALLDSDALGPMRKEGRGHKSDVAEPEDDVDDPAIIGSDFRQNARDIEDSENSSENEGDDDDATQTRYKSRRTENCEYDSDDFDEEVVEDGEREDDNDRQPSGKKEQMESMENTDVDPAPPTIKKKKKEKEKQKVPKGFTKGIEHDHQKRIEEVLQRYAMVVSYTFDTKDEQWCEVTLGLSLSFTRIDLSSLLRHVAEHSVVTETQGIKQAFVDTNSDGTVMLHTEGCNLTALFKEADLLDLKRLYSNDINAMALTYGIEAARAVLVREVRDVFRAYGITVDPRHLLLVADYMTFLGSYEPLSRRGMEAGCSPLQQMSFESSLTFVQSAALHGRRDALRSPSSRLMLGRPCALGTGIFSLHPALSLPA